MVPALASKAASNSSGSSSTLGAGRGGLWPRDVGGKLFRSVRDRTAASHVRLVAVAQVLCPVLVGREEELRALRECLAALADGTGGCVVLTGEPGIGKSRLAREAAAHARAQGATVATGRAVPAGASDAYRPLTEALLQALRGNPVLGHPDLAPWAPALAAIVPGLRPRHASAADASAAARGEAVLQLLRRLAGPAGLVVLLEDLHWADPDTMAVVEYLGDNVADAPVLLVLTVRTEPRSLALDLVRRQRGRAGVAHLALDRLDAERTTAMVLACAPGAAGDLVARVARTAEGVPLLVEELLASPGLPVSFNDTVRERLAEFEPDERAVIDAAAVLGRHFDWELLAPMCGQPAEVITRTLDLGAQQLLLSADGDGFRFRHALTREAVLECVLPPRHRTLASAGLAALEAAHPGLGAPWLELAADLAARAGARQRAGVLLGDAGRASLARGALATAIETLRRAADLLEGGAGRADVELVLVEALALAGRVDEAAAVGGQLIGRLGHGAAEVATRVEAHLRLAQAAVAASRWTMARHQLDAARAAEAEGGDGGLAPPTAARAMVLEAEIAFAADDTEGATRLAARALRVPGAGPDVCCHALELVGRAARYDDLAAARAAFERALATAEVANLPVWRLRALHELGTIDMFDHAGPERLSDARRMAERLGALSTAAVLDLQLAATFTCRWALDQADAHAHSAIAIAGSLGLAQVRAKALAMLSGTASMRADAQETERLLAATLAAAPDDQMLQGLAWGGRGMLALLDGDPAGAVRAFAPGMAVFAQLRHAEPAALRAVWPLLLASRRDRRAAAAIEEADRLGVGLFGLNRGLIEYAEAVLAGRRGERTRAEDTVARADRRFPNCEAWLDLARLLAAPSALADGWGAPREWLATAAEGFAGRALPRLAEQCRALLDGDRPNPWSAAGVTAREAEVLRLLVQGLANKVIAAELRVSPRTVEKHVESLLRKTNARSRTELAMVAARLVPEPRA